MFEKPVNFIVIWLLSIISLYLPFSLIFFDATYQLYYRIGVHLYLILLFVSLISISRMVYLYWNHKNITRTVTLISGIGLQGLAILYSIGFLVASYS